MADLRHLVDLFEHQHIVAVGDTDPDLVPENLERMKKKMKINGPNAWTAEQLLSSVNRHSQRSDTDVELNEGVVLGVSFVEFYAWLISNDPLAKQFKTGFDGKGGLDALLEQDKRKRQQPFPYLPGLSPIFAHWQVDDQFDNAMTIVILLNTVTMSWVSEVTTKLTIPMMCALLM